MLRVSKCFGLALLAVAVVASTSQAQRQRGQQGRGQGGGATGLLAMEEVQKEINLTDKQKTDVTALRDELRQNRPDFQGLQDLSGDERRAKIEEIRKQMEEASKKADEKLKTILDANQVTRLGELRIQREGTAALARAEVADKLGLNKQQKDKIAKLRTDANAAFGQRGRNQDQSDEDRQKARTEARERLEKLNSETLAVLTDAQKESFEKMKGKKFEFPQQQGRGRGNKEL